MVEFSKVSQAQRSLKGTETLKDSKLDSKGPWTVSMCRNICTLRPDDAEVDTQLLQIDFRVVWRIRMGALEKSLSLPVDRSLAVQIESATILGVQI